MRAFIILLFVAAIPGCAQEIDKASNSDVALIDVKPLVKVARYHYQNPPRDKSINKDIESIIVRKVLLVRSLQPEIDDLKGESIKSLCSVIAFSESKDFGNSINDEQVAQLAKDYLHKIRPDVQAKSQQLKKTIFVEKDCSL